MAGDWMPIRLDLPDDPDVIRIANATGLDEDEVVGKLVRVWSWFSKVSRDGHAPGVTNDWLDRYTGVTGMCQAMVSVGWMDVSDDGITMPNYGNWMSQSAKKRLQDQKRQRDRRDRNKSKSVTKTSRTERDKSVTREEKRREEKSKNTSCSLGAPAKIAFDYDAGKWQNITDKHRAKWSDTCPSISIDAELESMARWLTLRGNRYQDYGKFIANWLLRAAKDTAGNGPRKTGAELLDEYEAKHGQKRSQPD